MSKVNDLLTQLDDAFETAEAKTKDLSVVRQVATEAIVKQQAAFDAVQAKQTGLIQAAEQAADEARVALDRLRQQVNDRVGVLTGLGSDPRVTVK